MLGVVSSVLAKRLAGKNVSQMTYFVLSGTWLIWTWKRNWEGEWRGNEIDVDLLTVNLGRVQLASD